MVNVKPVQLGKTERMSFSRIDEVIDMPNLIEVQKNSYRWFLNEDVYKRQGLGYAPDSFRETRDHMRKLGYSDDELIEAGLLKRHEKGHTYDVFRNRVMVPIFDLRGNVIAFGGRNMGDEKPKYLNSPETMAYKKSRTLFALNVAKRSTRCV